MGWGVCMGCAAAHATDWGSSMAHRLYIWWIRWRIWGPCIWSMVCSMGRGGGGVGAWHVQCACSAKTRRFPRNVLVHAFAGTFEVMCVRVYHCVYVYLVHSAFWASSPYKRGRGKLALWPPWRGSTISLHGQVTGKRVQIYVPPPQAACELRLTRDKIRCTLAVSSTQSV